MSFPGSTTGRLTRDAELKSVPNNDKSVLKFSIATDRPGKNDDVDFFNCEMWVRPDDKRVNYLKKGGQVFITGRLEIDKYQKDGENRYAAKIKLESYGGLTLLGKANSAPEETAQPVPVATAVGADDNDVPF